MTSGDPENEDRGVDNGGDLPELDYDAAFAALVARFNEAPESPPGASANAEPTPIQSPEPVLPAEPGPPPTEAEPWYPPELDEHYEPPEPPPIPRGDLVSRLAWGGVLGGPVLLLIAAVVNGALPAMLVIGALVSFVAGFVTLVARMPAERPDDGDDGAVV